MNNLKTIWDGIRTASLLLLMLIGIGLVLVSYIPKANACDSRCFSVTCGSCDVSNIYCSSNCQGGQICLQEIGFCVDENRPCLCGVCTVPGFCN